MKKIDITFEIRPVFLRTISHIFILSFIGLYFVSEYFTLNRFIEIMSFSSSSSIFWLIIIFIILGHLDFLREIIKDVARSKISEFAASDYFRKSVTQLLNDDEFRNGVNEIIQRPAKEQDTNIAVGEEGLNSGNNINK